MPPGRVLRRLHPAPQQARTWDKGEDQNDGRLRRVQARRSAYTHPVPCPRALITNVERVWSPLMPFMNEILLHYSWVELVPSRIGSDERVTAAAEAVSAALSCRAQGANPDPFTLRIAFRSYNKALNTLRHHLASLDDATLAVAGLLVLYETFMIEDPAIRLRNCRAHWSGITALLHSRQKTGGGATSELSRSMLFSTFVCWYSIPIARGVPSPFEDAAWLDVEFASLYAIPTDTMKLRILAYRTMMSVPRLICYVRKLRTGHMADQAPLQDIEHNSIELAKQLLELKDEEAESALLHRVKVMSSPSAVDRMAIPTSFYFRSTDDFGAAVFYWHARMTVIKLCQRLVRLRTLDPLQHGLDCASWDIDLQRLTANTLMTWSFACAVGYMTSASLIMIWLSVWGALRDMDRLHATPASRVRAWLLPHMNGPGIVYSVDSLDSAARGWDAASDIMDGGPLSGAGPLKEFIDAVA